MQRIHPWFRSKCRTSYVPERSGYARRRRISIPIRSTADGVETKLFPANFRIRKSWRESAPPRTLISKVSFLPSTKFIAYLSNWDNVWKKTVTVLIQKNKRSAKSQRKQWYPSVQGHPWICCHRSVDFHRSDVVSRSNLSSFRWVQFAYLHTEQGSASLWKDTCSRYLTLEDTLCHNHRRIHHSGY